jgi:hypothetical protein
MKMQMALRFLYAGFLLLGFVLFVLGLVLDASFIEKYVTAGSTISNATLVKLNVIRAALFVFGVAFVGYSTLRLAGNAAAKNIEEQFCSLLVERPTAFLAVIWIVLLAFVTIDRVTTAYWSWQHAKGYEYYWIGQNIAEGNGFKYKNAERWLYSHQSTPAESMNDYSATAWEEPVYVAIIAFALSTWGDAGKLALVLFNVFVFLSTCVAVYYLGRRVFNRLTGMLASTALALWPIVSHASQRTFNTIHPALLGGALTVVCVLSVVWCLEKPSTRRGTVVGALLGLACLTLSPFQVFVPLTVILVLLMSKSRPGARWKTAAAIAVTTTVVISPWTIRNYLVFGEFVPVRTGAGAAAHQGNPTLAATFTDGRFACVESLGPFWVAENARDAILTANTVADRRSDIYRRSQQCVEKNAPEGYTFFNEAQRDNVYLENTLAFVFSEPQTFATLTFNKGFIFFTEPSRIFAIAAFLAAVGAVMALRNWRAIVLLLMVVAYSAPYCVLVAWFYRYRYPIEPLLLILASSALVATVSKVLRGVRGNYKTEAF